MPSKQPFKESKKSRGLMLPLTLPQKIRSHQFFCSNYTTEKQKHINSLDK